MTARGRSHPWLQPHLPSRPLHLLRHSVTLITLVQSVGGLGPLSTRGRVLDLSLQLVLSVTWTVVALRRRSDAIDLLSLTLAVGAAAGLAVLTGNGQVYVAGYAALFVAPFWYGMPTGLIPAASGVVAVTFATMFVGHRDIGGGIGNGVGAFFFGVAAWFWGRVMRSSEHNERLIAELRDSREAEQRSAIVSERARLARELHDVLAHTLSSLALHLESTRVLAKSRDVDLEVQSRIERAVSLARSGLEEARDAVGTLRDDDLPGAERLPSLIADFERSTGVACHFEQVGKPVPLTPEASVALFRSAQEALTNVGKHSKANRVDVRIEWDGDLVTLRVIDDGGGAVEAATLPGGGNGLRGMRERAELAGGQLAAGPTSRGFAVELRLPA